MSEESSPTGKKRRTERRHRSSTASPSSAITNTHLVDLSAMNDRKPAAAAKKINGTNRKKRPPIVDLTSEEAPHKNTAATAAITHHHRPRTSKAHNHNHVATIPAARAREKDPNEESDHALALQLQRTLELQEISTAGNKNLKEELDRALAIKLQQEYFGKEQTSDLDQQALASKEDKPNGINEDEKFAKQLQTQLHQQEKEKEEKEMVSTLSGKAWKFVEKVLEMHKQVQSSGGASAPHFDTVAVDDMVFLAEALLKTQQEFSEAGKPVHVDIGYHYTRRENMTRIKTDGLLTKAERDANGITSNYNGSAYGDGVYTGNEPFTFCAYGDVGLIVARLKGNAITDRDRFKVKRGANSYDTVLSTGRPMAVLRKSSQCLALVEYSVSILVRQTQNAGSKAVHSYHKELQKIVDEFFNGGKPTKVSKYVPVKLVMPSVSVPATAMVRNPMPPLQPTAAGTAPAVPPAIPVRVSIATARAVAAQAGSAPKKRRIAVVVPRTTSRTTRSNSNVETLRYEAPATLDQQTDLAGVFQDVPISTSDENCAICLTPLHGRQKVVSIKACDHEFHFSCVKSALQHSKSCPVCRKGVGKPQGKMPSGAMVVVRNPSITCAGFAPGCIIIQYSIPRGVQKKYHVSPGTQHGSAHRIAYLPDNEEGRKLLKRLKFAFQHGLTFTVGSSLTSRQPNQVTWSSIHHKTSASGGSHGFPDPNYFSNCNQDLDALNVPSADDL